MSTFEDSLAQLLAMGIPAGRAKAALTRTKGDVLSATERVFGGDFDAIPSDEEGDINADDTDGAHDIEIKNCTIEAVPITQMVQQGMHISDDRESEGSAIDYDEEYAFSDSEEHLISDPYEGIFFSKDRTEIVIETIETPIFAQVPTQKSSLSIKPTMEVRVLSRGEWMRGCPEGNEQSFLLQLYLLLTEGRMPCSGVCGYEFRRRPDHFFALYPTFQEYREGLANTIRPECPWCKMVTCLACGKQTERSIGKTKPKDKTMKDYKNVDSDVLFHCSNIQGVILGVGLYMIEEEFIKSKNMTLLLPQRDSPPMKRLKMSEVQVPSYYIFNESASSSSSGNIPSNHACPSGGGIGYSGRVNEDRSGQVVAERAQTVSDENISLLLSQVRVFLPSDTRAGGPHISDHLVHPTALAHLRRRSGFVNDLLRNDSLLDMSNRKYIYQALFDWLQVVSRHESLSSMLAMPQMRAVKSKPGPQDNQLQVTYEGSSSPRELLENVVIQATVALRGLSSTSHLKQVRNGDRLSETGKNRLELQVSMPEVVTAAKPTILGKEHEENDILKQFCNRILSARDLIDRLLVQTKGQSFVDRMHECFPGLLHSSSAFSQLQSVESIEANRKNYEEWAISSRFQYCDLREKSGHDYYHAHNTLIKAIECMDAPKRSLAIAKELAILTTSLPASWASSIFLRVDESRIDCIKAMIIGPEGTPYENGCFIFDIFLPLDYNMTCPRVTLVTTNGGRYRYNPNLYADGTVCLSLLGTWPGPGWIPGKSTILQLLISIQSLIMCEEPYLNEPAWSSETGSTDSRKYSADVRRMVVADAMANNIRNPPFPFKTEIETHFRLKAKHIDAQLDRWKDLDNERLILSDTQSLEGKNDREHESTFDIYARQLRTLLELENPAKSGPRRNPPRATRAKKGAFLG